MIVKNKTILSVNVVRDMWGAYWAHLLYNSPSDPAGTNDTREVHGVGACAESAVGKAFSGYNAIPDTWDGKPEDGCNGCKDCKGCKGCKDCEGCIR